MAEQLILKDHSPQGSFTTGAGGDDSSGSARLRSSVGITDSPRWAKAWSGVISRSCNGFLNACSRFQLNFVRSAIQRLRSVNSHLIREVMRNERLGWVRDRGDLVYRDRQ